MSSTEDNANEPFFLLVEEGEVSSLPIPDKNFIILDNAPEADIQIPSHLGESIAIIRVKKSLLFVSRNPQAPCLFNGHVTPQSVIPDHAKMFIKTPNAWLIYNGGHEHAQEVNPRNPHIRVNYQEQKFISDGEPILFGHHPSCDVIIGTDEQPDYSAILYWTRDGLFLEHFHNPELNDGDRVPVTENSSFKIGDKEVTLEIEGNVKYAAYKNFEKLEEPPALTMSFFDRDVKENVEIPLKRRITLGRGEDADIYVNWPTVSRLHAVLSWHRDRLYIEDLDSLHHTKVNGIEVIDKQLLIPGDHINLGDCTSILHYDFDA